MPQITAITKATNHSLKKISKSKSKIKKDIEEKKKQAQEKEIEYLRPKVDCSPTVALSSLADSSIVITIRAWTRSEFYWPVYYSINEKIYKEFPKNGLKFPIPTNGYTCDTQLKLPYTASSTIHY